MYCIRSGVARCELTTTADLWALESMHSISWHQMGWSSTATVGLRQRSELVKKHGYPCRLQQCSDYFGMTMILYTRKTNGKRTRSMFQLKRGIGFPMLTLNIVLHRRRKRETRGGCQVTRLVEIACCCLAGQKPGACRVADAASSYSLSL